MLNSIKKIYKWYNRPNKTTIAYYVETLLFVLPVAFLVRTYIYGLYLVPTGSMETTMLVGERFWADKLTIHFRSIKHDDIVSFNAPPIAFNYSKNYFINMFQRYVYGPANWTKRVIGIPGDHLKGVIEEGKPVIYRNGEKINRSCVNQYPLVAAYQESSNNLPWSYISYDPNKPADDQPFYSVSEEDLRHAKRLVEANGYESIKPSNSPTLSFSNGRVIDEFDIVLGKNQYWVQGDNLRGSWDSRDWGPLDGTLIHGRIVFCILSIDTRESWLILDLLFHPISFWKRVRWSRCFRWIS